MSLDGVYNGSAWQAPLLLLEPGLPQAVAPRPHYHLVTLLNRDASCNIFT